MSTVPQYRTRAEAMVDFEAGRCPRWVYVDGWQIDLLTPPGLARVSVEVWRSEPTDPPPVLAPVERVEPVAPPARSDHALASTIVAMAYGVRWAGLSEEEQARVAALVDEIGRVVRPRSETNGTNEGAKR